MSQQSGESPFNPLAEAIVCLASGLVEYRDFIGRKKAELTMNEIGVKNTGDDTLDTMLTNFFGTCTTTGIVLSMRGETDDASLDDNTDRLVGQLPETVGPVIAHIARYMVHVGMEFHEHEMQPDNPLLKQWSDEYELLQSISTPE